MPYTVPRLTPSGTVHIVSGFEADNDSQIISGTAIFGGGNFTVIFHPWSLTQTYDEEEESDYQAALEARKKPGALPWRQVKDQLES